MRAACVYASPAYRDAVREALRRQVMCQSKFGGPPQRWRFRVRKRWADGHTLWRVYIPTGEVPR